MTGFKKVVLFLKVIVSLMMVLKKFLNDDTKKVPKKFLNNGIETV